MKKMGRKHQPFYRICAMDGRAPRDGKVIEELGHYDPLVKETDARAILKGERIDYWLSVGAQPSEKVRVLIQKYGTHGTHLEQQKSALERVKLNKPMAPPPRVVPRPKPEEPAAPEAPPAAEPAAAADPAAAEAPAEAAPVTAEG
jgi:small subunit ribosomal protein S16